MLPQPSYVNQASWPDFPYVRMLGLVGVRRLKKNAHQVNLCHVTLGYILHKLLPQLSPRVTTYKLSEAPAKVDDVCVNLWKFRCLEKGCEISKGVQLRDLAVATTPATYLERPFTRTIENELLHSKQQNYCVA